MLICKYNRWGTNTGSNIYKKILVYQYTWKDSKLHVLSFSPFSQESTGGFKTKFRRKKKDAVEYTDSKGYKTEEKNVSVFMLVKAAIFTFQHLQMLRSTLSTLIIKVIFYKCDDYFANAMDLDNFFTLALSKEHSAFFKKLLLSNSK